MPGQSSVVLSSLFKYPYIADRIARIGPTSQAISNFYGMGISASGREGNILSGTARSDFRKFVHDIFNNTRQTNTLKAPGTGPSFIKPQKTGQVVANALRFYEARTFEYNEIAQYRPLGKLPGTLDKMGQQFVTRQMDDLIRRSINGREFAFINMLKGGFKVVAVGNDQLQCVPTAYSSVTAEFEVNFQLPSSHKNKVTFGGTDLISASWDNASTPIITDLRKIRAKAVERSGLPLTECWCNTTIMNHLLNCTEAQNQGGDAFRVFDRLSQREVPTGSPDVSSASSKYVIDVKLRAFPEMTFHVCDDGFVLPADQASPVEAEDYEDSVPTGSSFQKYLSDTEVILTPPPSLAGEYLEMYAVLEYIMREYGKPVEPIYGLAAFGRKKPEPTPRFEFHVLDNYLPALKIPNAVYNPTVVF